MGGLAMLHFKKPVVNPSLSVGPLQSACTSFASSSSSLLVYSQGVCTWFACYLLAPAHQPSFQFASLTTQGKCIRVFSHRNMKAPQKARDSNCWKGLLMKDKKAVCDVQSFSAPLKLPPRLAILGFEVASIYPLSVLPHFKICPLGANPQRLAEWKRFVTYLVDRHKVAILMIDDWDMFINPPSGPVGHKQFVFMSYRKKVTSLPTSYILQDCHSLDVVTGTEDDRSRYALSRFARTHPSYMETLGQMHASWIFGAIAELVDNARDAGATRLDVCIEQEYFHAKKLSIPILCITDNGTGMTYMDLTRMMAFGHKRPSDDDESLLGRFGVGFKTGSMRLGKDGVVFTQSKDSRSIASFSRSFNETKEEVEIPIVTYTRNLGWMEFDTNFQSHEQATANLRAIKEFSPFNEYMIGPKFKAFGDKTGTIICIYNLDRWGSQHTLSWDPKLASETDTKLKSDIQVRSRRVRARPGQMSREVPLDYSLRAYLEVIFLEPRMEIYVQGTLVGTRSLQQSLCKRKVLDDVLGGKKVKLTLGFSQEERARGNCGIFLYWHGRLIEAYKRVGGMIHNADVGLGVIGVMDVTDVMRLENGSVAILNNKQGFSDCEAYAALEEWLGIKADGYWDENFDKLKVEEEEEHAVYSEAKEWVQCNKCLKWRAFDKSFNAKNLPAEWFCFMPPFMESCAVPEEKVGEEVVTLKATRTF
ncbi:hypothetical protein GOP47_0017406 [Adiantum capillus-veneris]|uniref:CW-type domain-containing protein n=1 Tax=Adiantum capillus-veneris TaxID=13818 RepID=A0A9D4Z952_ADICA|nr:hypothetical protein GOP47_0017406 [Adiantum capillus-veneris]